MRHLRPRRIRLLLLLVLIVAAVEIGRSLAEPDPEPVVVPAVVELGEAEAVRRLTAAGFRPAVARRPAGGPRGVVLEQDPGAGTLLDAGGEVLLTVSAGPSVVPQLLGLSLPVAANRLRDAGLELRFRAVISKQAPGVVVATDPAPGESVVPGAAVAVSVSKGRRRVAVPSLLWRDEAEARASLRQAGFGARVFEVPSEEPAGTVVAQSPSPGVELDGGSRVRVDVSTGAGDPALPRALVVPNVVGRSLPTAQDRLGTAGFVVRAAYSTAGAPVGQVIEQDPPAATTERRGANVRVTVSAGSDPDGLLEVISLVGLLEDGATSAIETAGFLPRVLRERTPDPAEVGVVVRQEPEAYRKAPQGGQVTIYVGAAMK